MTKRLVLKEADVQRTVTDALRAFGWRYVHFTPAQYRNGRWRTPYTGDDGFPDIIAVREGRALVMEIKGTRGAKMPPPSRVTERARRAEQEEWLRQCSTVEGVTALLVTPETLDAALLEISR